MDVEIVDIDEKEAKFIVEGISPAFANGLRRTIVGGVPTMTIDKVDIYENTSVMFDEVLTLRLGLVPISTDLDEFDLPEECECGGEGCPNCQASLTVDVSAENGDRTVYSADLEPQHPMVEPVDKNIPVIELKEGQEVIAECIAELGLGQEHAKNQAGVAVGYKYLKQVELDPEEPHDDDIVRGILRGPDGELYDMEEYGNRLDEVFDEEVGIKDVDESFVFNVESDGSLSADDLVVAASDILSSKAKELGEKVSP
ncbi:MAG: DNA-directed RNA polymerase subunit D [Halobacteria archaeon]